MTTIAEIRAEAAPGIFGNTANIVQVPRDRFEALCGVAEAAWKVKLDVMTSTDIYDHTFILPNDTSGESQQFVTDIRSLRAALDALDD